MQFEAIDTASATVERQLRVACFANQFGDARGHGLARYARELLDALRAFGGPSVVPVAGWTSLDDRDFAARQRETGLQLTGLGRRGTSMLWTFLDRPTLESRLDVPIDVVHAVSLGYPIATRKPLVVTIHDLGPLTHPEFFRNTRPWVMQRSLDQAVRQAEVIVCVSQSTADEVREVAGPSVEDRLRVVVEGVSERFFEASDPGLLQRFGFPDGTPFILSAGMASPRKNLDGLLRAMASAADQIPHHLVLVGGSGWDEDDISKAMQAPSLDGRVHRTGYVTDDELRALYQAADLYVHPSLYEGFGLPILEAMASGTAVVSSDRTSLPEVVGTAGRLCDAADPDALAEAIVDVCTSEDLKRQMVEKGRANAAAFRWSDCASAMAAVYAEAARGGG